MATTLGVVGIDGSIWGSLTEMVVRPIVDELYRRGAVSEAFAGPDLVLRPSESGHRSNGIAALVEAVRDADALVIGSPGHTAPLAP